jgi:flavin-dependent dehydrogenase
MLESVEDGWWYSASMPNSDVVTVYMTDADLYAKASRAEANYWRRKLQNTTHTSQRVSGLALTSGPLIVAANSSRIDQAARHNWLAVGDAAIALDPLSGQGITKAPDSGIRASHDICTYFSGPKSSFEAYAATIENCFHDYQIMRNHYYRFENRWPESPFWKRRQSPPKKTIY